MTSGTDWPVDVVPIGPVAMGSTLWRAQGKLNAAVFVKATFRLVPGGVMACAEPLPVERGERYAYGSPLASLQAVNESLPVLPQVDVVVYGHAHAPGGTNGSVPVPQSTARLEVVRNGQPIIDKAVRVYGKRRRGEAPEPFLSLPLGYDHALGGIGFADNPIGVGADPTQPELPSFVDPDQPESRVACFGPIPPSFPSRRRLLGTFGRHRLSERVVEITDDLDWTYFQSAPDDQRLDQLQGDETLALEGLTAGQGVVRTTFPGARALVQVYPRGTPPVEGPRPLRADLVQIDTDRMQCTVVWRTSLPLATERDAQAMVLAGALELPGQAVHWPASVTELQAQATSRAGHGVSEPPSSPTSDHPVDLEGTHVLSATQAVAAAAAPTAPFALPRPAAPGGSEDQLAQTFPGAPWGKAKPTPAPLPLSHGKADTVSVDVELPADDEEDLVVPATQPPGPSHDELEAKRRQQFEAVELARLEAKRTAARRAAEEAERQRETDAARFAAEQQAAREAEQRRGAEKQARKTRAAHKFKTSLYSNFRKPG